jgi:hypothetical protein
VLINLSLLTLLLNLDEIILETMETLEVEVIEVIVEVE